jgi:hypothetical protein
VQHLCAPSPSISERGIAGCESCVYCVRPPAVSRSSAALPLSLFSLSLGSPSPSLRILYMVSLSLNVPFSLSLTHTLCSPSLPLCHLSLPHSVLAARCTASAFRTRRGPRPALSLSLSLSLFSLSALSALSLPHSVLAARRTLFASRRPPGPRPAPVTARTAAARTPWRPPAHQRGLLTNQSKVADRYLMNPKT